MFAISDQNILKYVENYHLHLIVPKEITDFDKFRTSLREVLEIIKASDDKKAMKEVIESNPRFKEIENEVVSTINVFTGMKIPVKKKEGKMDMCKAYEEQRLCDMAKGKAEDAVEFLEEIGEPSSALRKLIMEQTDLEVLRKWVKLAARAESIEDFEEKAGILEKV